MRTLAAWRPGAGGRGRDPVHARARPAPGLHGRAGGRRPRRDARRDGRPRRRPAPGSTRSCRPTSSSTTRSRSTGSARRPRSPSTSTASTSATASATSSCAGRRRRSDDLRVVPPGTGIVHQVNLEYLATVVATRADADGPLAFPDTLVGHRLAHDDDQRPRRARLRRRRHRGRGGPARPAALPADAADRRRPAPRRAAARLDGDRPRPRRDRDAPPLRRRRVRSSSSPATGWPAWRCADRATIAQHEPRVRGDVDALPDRRRDARLPAPDRPDRPSASTSSSATPRRRACGASPGPAPDVRRPARARPRAASSRPSPDRAGRRTGSRCPTCRRTSGPRSRPPRRQRPPTGWTTRAAGRRSRERGDRRGRHERRPIRTGSVAIAAITSCTNTSNPTVMVGAGLLARNAVARGLRVAPTVKTSLAPGSKAVTGYLEAAGLMAPLDAARLRAGRLRLHDLHRQLRAARRADRRGDRGARPRRRGRPVGQPQLRGPDPPARPGELPRLAAARRRLRAGRPGRHRPDHRAARPRPRRPAGLPGRHLAGAGGDPDASSATSIDPELFRRDLRHASSRATTAGGRCRSRPATGTPGTRSRPTSPGRRSSTGIGLEPAPLRRHRRRPRPGRPRRLGHDRPHLAGRLDRAVRRRPGPGSRTTASARSTSTRTAPGAATTR